MALPPVHPGSRCEASIEIADWSRESRVESIDCDIAVEGADGALHRSNTSGRVDHSGHVRFHFQVTAEARRGGRYTLTFTMSQNDGRDNLAPFGESISDSGPIQ
jgi:hypothetical protein